MLAQRHSAVRARTRRPHGSTSRAELGHAHSSARPMCSIPRKMPASMMHQTTIVTAKRLLTYAALAFRKATATGRQQAQAQLRYCRSKHTDTAALYRRGSRGVAHVSMLDRWSAEWTELLAALPPVPALPPRKRAPLLVPPPPPRDTSSGSDMYAAQMLAIVLVQPTLAGAVGKLNRRDHARAATGDRTDVHFEKHFTNV
jgi:hypothetical protein